MHDFDEIIDRKGTNSLKHDFAAERGMPEGLLPMWVADMDFRAPQGVLEALRATAEHGVFGYSQPDEGYFRALRAWFLRDFGFDAKHEWIIPAPGVVFAIAVAIRAFTEEGGAVLIQQPVYYPFAGLARRNGRVVANSPLRMENGSYRMDLDDFERKLRESRAKLFILCSPHNPVGRVWRADELYAVGEICRRHGCVVLSDEIHCDFTFPGSRHKIFAGLSEEFNDMSVICTAPTKTFNLAAAQISNIIIANDGLRRRFRAALEATGYSQCNIFGIRACQAAYELGLPWLEALRSYLLGNLSHVRAFLERELPQVKLVEPEGTYLAWLDCRAAGLEPDELDDRIVRKAGLWLDGGRMFGEEGAGFQRINIACPRAVLKEAMERLALAFR